MSSKYAFHLQYSTLQNVTGCNNAYYTSREYALVSSHYPFYPSPTITNFIHWLPQHKCLYRYNLFQNSRVAGTSLYSCIGDRLIMIACTLYILVQYIQYLYSTSI